MPSIIDIGRVRVVLQIGGEDVVFVCRQPSGAEVSKFLSARFISKRNKMISRLYEARAEFVDSVLVDVENAQFRTASGEIKSLNSQTELTVEDKETYSRALQTEVKSWKDLIPLNWKSSVAMHFEDQQAETGEGN